MGQEKGTSGQPVPRHLTKLGLTGLPGQPAGGCREASVVSCSQEARSVQEMASGLRGRDDNVREEEAKRHHCWKVHLRSHQPLMLPGEGTRHLSVLFPETHSHVSSGGPPGQVLTNSFRSTLPPQSISFPHGAGPQSPLGGTPAQTSPTTPPVTCVLGTKTCCIFNSLWQSHPSFHPGKCHHMGKILPCPCPCPRLGLCFLVYPGQLEHA